MRKVLFVISRLEYSGPTGQLVLLIDYLPRPEFELHVCVLGPEGPPTVRGVPVEFLGWKHLLDFKPLIRLRERIHGYQPDVIHAWGGPALRAVALVGGAQNHRLVVSGVPPRRQPGLRIPWLDRWLLGRAAAGSAGLGLLAPGAVLQAGPARPPGVPASARLLVGVGPLEPAKGYRDGIWVLDILRFLYEDLHLVLVGNGSDRPRLERFARIVRMEDRIHFVGHQETVAPWLAAAEVVWVPSHAEAGVNVALEAMSLGRPVIATRVPGLREIVADGETGFLIRPGDKAGLARRTRRLLDDPVLCRRFGEAARQRIRHHFSAEAQAEGYAELYRGTQSMQIA
jgi:hypothetical protein